MDATALNMQSDDLGGVTDAKIIRPPFVDDDDCAICLNNASYQPLCTTPCGHKYCEACLGLYALKRLPSGRVPCPLCRASLKAEDAPERVTLALTRPSGGGGAFGLTVSSGTQASEPGKVCIKAVLAASPAAAAGLRVGMRILAIDGVAELRTANQFMTHANGCKTTLNLTIDLRQVLAESMARAEAGATAAEDNNNAAAAHRVAMGGLENAGQTDDLQIQVCFCYCSVVSVLWQRALRLPAWCCVLPSTVLWITFGASSWCFFVALLSGGYLANLYAIGLAFLLGVYLCGGALLACAECYLRRFEPATWRSVLLQGGRAQDGQLCGEGAGCCCCLATKLAVVLFPVAERRSRECCWYCSMHPVPLRPAHVAVTAGASMLRVTPAAEARTAAGGTALPTAVTQVELHTAVPGGAAERENGAVGPRDIEMGQL